MPKRGVKVQSPSILLKFQYKPRFPNILLFLFTPLSALSFSTIYLSIHHLSITYQSSTLLSSLYISYLEYTLPSFYSMQFDKENVRLYVDGCGTLFRHHRSSLSSDESDAVVLIWM